MTINRKGNVYAASNLVRLMQAMYVSGFSHNDIQP